jgi:hypothetical protein
VIAEELGFAGVALVIILFTLVIMRRDGRQAAALGAASGWLAGVGIWLGVQAIINMGVSMGVLPTRDLRCRCFHSAARHHLPVLRACRAVARRLGEPTVMRGGGMNHYHDYGGRHGRPYFPAVSVADYLRAQGWAWSGQDKAGMSRR